MDKDTFDSIYGDLPDGAYMAAAEEMGVDLTADPDREKKDRMDYAIKKLLGLGYQVKTVGDHNAYAVKIGPWNFWTWTGRFHKDGGPRVDGRGLQAFIGILKKEGGPGAFKRYQGGKINFPKKNLHKN